MELINKETTIREIMSEPTETHYPSWYADKIKRIKSESGDNWISVKDRYPEPLKTVMLCCEQSLHLHRILEDTRYICLGQWIPKNCEGALDINWDVETLEYDEETDEYYPLEGFYESIFNWDEYGLIGIGDFVVAWREMPEVYKGE